MTHRGGWKLGFASVVPALLLGHSGCAGRSVSHDEASGGGAGEQSVGTGGTAGTGTSATGGTSAARATGGTAGTGMGAAAGISGTGATVGISGKPGTGATGGTGAAPPAPVLDFASIDCDPILARPGSENPPAAEFLNTSCAKSFCHGKSFIVGLDLRPDAGFAQRLLDAPALYRGIPCPDDITQECVPASCPAPGTALLIDSANPTASWILTKAHNKQLDCGDPAPDKAGLTPAEDACLTAIVNATAALK